MTIHDATVACLPGPEFPFLLVGLVGLLIVIPATLRNLLLSDDKWDFPPHEQWESGLDGEDLANFLDPDGVSIRLFEAWTI